MIQLLQAIFNKQRRGDHNLKVIVEKSCTAFHTAQMEDGFKILGIMRYCPCNRNHTIVYYTGKLINNRLSGCKINVHKMFMFTI